MKYKAMGMYEEAVMTFVKFPVFRVFIVGAQLLVTSSILCYYSQNFCGGLWKTLETCGCVIDSYKKLYT
jgi:hypothetical protein